MLRLRIGEPFEKLLFGTTYDVWCITRRCVKREGGETRLSRSKGERPVLLAPGLCAVKRLSRSKRGEASALSAWPLRRHVARLPERSLAAVYRTTVASCTARLATGYLRGGGTLSNSTEYR
jgi:hypothetical protein